MGGMGGIGRADGAAWAGTTAKKKLVTQTRTDFLIQFVWQPPTAEKPAKPIEEIRKELAAAENDEKNKGAVAADRPVQARAAARGRSRSRARRT